MGTFMIHDLAGRRSVVTARQMTIGRSRQNDLVLEAPLASRRHAWMWRQGNQDILEDLGSTHGTWVNGQRLAGPRFLNTGDVIHMGDARLLYLADQDPSTVDTPAQQMAPWVEYPLYCPRCGAANEQRAAYCSRCGLSLAAQHWQPLAAQAPAPRRPITPIEPPVIRPFPTMPAPVAPRQQSYVPILLLAIVTVLLLITLGVLAIYLLVFAG